MKRFFNFSVIAALFLLAPASFCMDSTAKNQNIGKQFLWFFPQEKLDAKTYQGFSKDVFGDLSLGLLEIGYNFRNYSMDDSLITSAKNQDNLCMYIHVADTSVNFGSAKSQSILVELSKIGDLVKAKNNPGVFRPFVSIVYSPDDPASLRSILIKKIMENLRTQYICNVSIGSEPPGVQIKTSRGLVDITPLEWVVPVGMLHIQGTMKKYMPLEKDLQLPKPGAYTYFLQMKKKQFYHSKFMYPALAMLVSSALCYYADGYYYNRYNQLGEFELHNDPESFGVTFQKAQNFERASIASILLCGVFAGLTFWF